MEFFVRTIAVLPLMLLGMSNAAANLVSNPSFETFTGTFDGTGASSIPVGSAELVGWNIVENEIAVLRNGHVSNTASSDGNNFLDLTGFTDKGFPKGISQSLNGLVTGRTYSFALDLGIRNGLCVSGGNICGGPIKVTASIGSAGGPTISQTFTHASSDPGNIWDTFGFSFLADNPSMTLSILGNQPAGLYIGLDNVSVVAAVPLPAAAWLFGTGLLTLLGVSKKRRLSVA